MGFPTHSFSSNLHETDLFAALIPLVSSHRDELRDQQTEHGANAISPVLNKPVPRTLFNFQQLLFQKTQSEWVHRTPENSSSKKGKGRIMLEESLQAAETHDRTQGPIDSNADDKNSGKLTWWRTRKGTDGSYKTLWGGCQVLGERAQWRVFV